MQHETETPDCGIRFATATISIAQRRRLRLLRRCITLQLATLNIGSTVCRPMRAFNDVHSIGAYGVTGHLKGQQNLVFHENWKNKNSSVVSLSFMSISISLLPTRTMYQNSYCVPDWTLPFVTCTETNPIKYCFSLLLLLLLRFDISHGAREEEHTHKKVNISESKHSIRRQRRVLNEFNIKIYWNAKFARTYPSSSSSSCSKYCKRNLWRKLVRALGVRSLDRQNSFSSRSFIRR